MVFSVSGALISTEMNGLPLVVLPSSRTRTRSEAPATSCMYWTILSQRASLVSAPTLKPRNCSGVCGAAAGWVAGAWARVATVANGVAITQAATIATSARRGDMAGPFLDECEDGQL